MQQATALKQTDTILDLDDFVSPGNHPAANLRVLPNDRARGAARPRLYYASDPAKSHARYKQVLESLEKLTNKSVDIIHIVGGGSRNNLLNQLAADVTGRRVIAGPAEATAIGNALTQAMGAGAIGSLEELRAIVRQSFDVEEFLPRHVAAVLAVASGRIKNCCLSIDGSTATSKNPTIISAHVCSPHFTAESGSGLCGLFLELSNVATACSIVPAFSGIGSANR